MYGYSLAGTTAFREQPNGAGMLHCSNNGAANCSIISGTYAPPGDICRMGLANAGHVGAAISD
jgi:hypothetical protein